MTDWSEQRVGSWLAGAGGMAFWVAAMAGLALGAVDLVRGRPDGSYLAVSDAILLAALGALALLFATLGRRVWKDRPFTTAVLLILVAVVGAAIAGPGPGAFAGVGAVLAGFGGVLFLIDPLERAAHRVATA